MDDAVLKEKIALLFDLDGTLINSYIKFGLDVQGTIKRLGTEISLEEALSSKDWHSLAENYGYTREQFEQEFKNRKSWQQSLEDGEVPLYEDSIPALKTLAAAGYNTLALVTRSKPEDTKQKLNYFQQLSEYFPIKKITLPDKKIYPSKVKEAKEAVAELREKNPDITLVFVIGDADDDVITANTLKDEFAHEQTGIHVKSVYVDRVSKPLAQNLKPDYTINNLREFAENILFCKQLTEYAAKENDTTTD